jgi:hypothetical protein
VVLAAVDGGSAAARALAQQHGVSLVSLTFEPESGQVNVVVRLGTATASAAAREDP